MTQDERKALREAAEIANTQSWPGGWYSEGSAALTGLHGPDRPFVSFASPKSILSLLDALADAEAKLVKARDDALEEAAKAAMGPVIEVNISTNEPSLCGDYNGGNWSVPQPIAGYKGSDYGNARYDAAAAIRSLKSITET
jgi:hypothetical protein